jgi:heat shock protein HslJ
MNTDFKLLFFFSLLAAALVMVPQVCQACNDAPTLEELANGTYTGIEDHPVKLIDGRWEGEPYAEGGSSRPSVGLVNDFQLHGDLDGDGADEIVVLLWQSSGGSGTFDYLAVMGRKDGAVRNLATAAIGDRVQVRSGTIEDGHIVLDVVQQGDGDAACCATQLSTRTWSLDGGDLTEGEAEITGKLSIEILEGTEWVLTGLKRDEPLGQESEVTLLFADGQVSGKSACNRYSAGVEQGDAPSALKIGPAMGTRMACPGGLMDVEQQYLEALSQVTGFSFLAGQLVLNRDEDGVPSAMVFTPR